MFKFLLYKLGQAIICWLPLNFSYRLAIFLSDLHYYFSFRDRRFVRNNLRAILRRQDNIQVLTREVFRNFGRYLLEFFLMNRIMDQDYIKKNVQFKNLEYISEALKRGKGAIFLTAHIGNWELGGVLLSSLGYPLTAIALPHKERPVNDLFNRQREIRGIKVVPTRLAYRRCLEALKNNQFVALVADRDFSLKGELLDFLGRKTLIPKGAALFSIQTGAPIVPVFLMRQEDHTFVLTVNEPIYPPLETAGQIDRDILLDLMKRYAGIIEDQIQRYPTQWLMFRQFWADQQSLLRKTAEIEGNLKGVF